MIKGKVICAVRNNDDLEIALKSSAESVFMLSTNLETVACQIEKTHQAGKKLFVHIDLADGIGKDEFGIKYLKSIGADGIISTRTNIIKTAKKLGVFTIQRFFIVDSRSIDTTVESASASKADVIELMPGTIGKVIKKIKGLIDTPIVAGGIIETVEEIEEAILNGAVAVSTGKKGLW